VKKIVFLAVISILLMLVTDNIWAQEKKVVPKWPVTCHQGVFFGNSEDNCYYVQGGYRIWGWIVLGGNFEIDDILIVNKLDKIYKKSIDAERRNSIQGTSFIGIQTPYFGSIIYSDPRGREPAFAGRIELHFGVQKNGFGIYPISYVRVGFNFIPIILGISVDYVLWSPVPTPINGWSIENGPKFKLAFSLLAFQF